MSSALKAEIAAKLAARESLTDSEAKAIFEDEVFPVTHRRRVGQGVVVNSRAYESLVTYFRCDGEIYGIDWLHNPKCPGGTDNLTHGATFCVSKPCAD